MIKQITLRKIVKNLLPYYIVRRIQFKNFNQNVNIIIPKGDRSYLANYNEIKEKFIGMDLNKETELYDCLSEYYFSTNKGNGYLDTDIGKNDMKDHMINRLLNFRKTIIPWINSFSKINHSSILEIGCGTGSTTIALAEQNANLTCIDVEKEHIKVAKKRCELYNVRADILLMNATELDKLNNNFDIIIFSASLEHMTYEERITSIRLAWEKLNKNGFLIVIETPNRLHHFDSHSSILPFYHWLPDQLAMQYSIFSPRERCKECSADEMKFIRFGRGVSFHEFEISLGIRCNEFIVEFIQSFIPNFHSQDYEYVKFIKQFAPKNISDAFFYNHLYFGIKKT